MTQLARPSDLDQPSILRPLSKYNPPHGGVLVPDIRVTPFSATISGGHRDANGIPVPNRDGTISLHDPEDQAPGLREALEATEYKSLTIGFGWNDPALFITQRRAMYVQSERARQKGGVATLSIVGDEHGLVTWQNGRRIELRPDTPEFDQAWGKTAQETWVFFYLADFDADGAPGLLFPENTSIPYRLRFGGTNSHRALEACLQSLRPQYAMMPIKLTLKGDFPVMQPDGKRTYAPVWQFAPMLAPEGTRGTRMRLDSRRLIALRQGAREQSTALALPAPSADVVREVMLSESTPDVPTDADVEIMLRGGPCDPARWKRVFHRLARNTRIGTDEGRATFMDWYTRRNKSRVAVTTSLREFLDHASELDAAEMIDSMLTVIERTETVNADGEPIDVPAGQTSNAGPTPEPPKQEAPSHNQEPSVPPPASALSAPAASPASGVSADASEEPPTSDASMISCPQCEAEQEDHDGFGFLHCDKCGYCTHPSINGEVCGLCNQVIKPGAVPVYAECANCSTVQPCIDDGEALVCTDVAACQMRVETSEADPVKASVNAWLFTLSRLFREASKDPAEKAQKAEVGRVLSGVAGGDRALALRLLMQITGRGQLADLSAGHVEVLLAAAKRPDWQAHVNQVRRVIELDAQP